MNFKVDDLKAGPKATMAKLNQWAAAIRWILDWIDAQPANAAPPPSVKFRVIEEQEDGTFLLKTFSGSGTLE